MIKLLFNFNIYEKIPINDRESRKKQNELFKLEDAYLKKIAIEISQDFKTWIFNNFELTNEQIKTFEGNPQSYNFIMGWQSASAIIYRDYVAFEQINIKDSRLVGSNNATIEGTIEVGVDNNGKINGKVGVKIKC